VHAPTEDKIDDIKCSFYGELEHVFYQFLKKILLDFNAKVRREDIFNPGMRVCMKLVMIMGLE
jgi:hypothetical protein